MPDVHLGKVANLSVNAHIRAIDGHGRIPSSATLSLSQEIETRELDTEVTWVGVARGG